MDSYSEHAPTLTAPARNAVSVTPSDLAELAQTSRALYVGQTGNLSVELADGGQVVLTNVQAGSLLPLRVLKVRTSGTTAADIVALW